MIDKIQVIDPYILIMDRLIAKSLYVFDRRGGFIRKIGSIGQGPGEYVSIADFAIDRENKTVYIVDGRLPRIHKFDIATGKFIQTIALARNAGSALIDRIVFVGGNLYASAIFYNHSPNNFLLFTIDESSGKEKNNFLNVMEYNKGFSNVYGNNIPDRPFFSRGNCDAIFVRPMMNHIIEITKDGVFSLFELKGKNMLTSSDAKRLFESYSPEEMKKAPPAFLQIKKYTAMQSYIEKGETIIMRMMIGMTIHYIVINKRTNEVCVYKRSYNDLLYNEEPRIIAFCNGITSDSAGVYYHTSSRRSNGVPELQELYKAGALSPGVIGLEKIMELKDDDNPLLIYYEFKEE